LRKEQAFDDTFNNDRSTYASTLGATANQNNRGVRKSKYIQSSPTQAFSTAARMARVQSFANSPLSLSAARKSSTTTALHMVLSTPDSIIEQASTQKLLDTLLDESVRTQSRQPIMMQFNPKRTWIWRQWRGTVFSETWKSGLLNMALATFVVFLYGLYPSLKDNLQGFSILWGQLLSVTTFTLTFFLNQSYGLWRKCYDYSRRLQGRLNDLGMTLAAHATRTKPSSPDVPSTYTPQSKQALELVSRYVRVFNLLTYASFTRSHRPILTPRGMRRLVERGMITSKEWQILTDAEVPATQRHNAVLVWLIRLFLEGHTAGVFEGGMGFEQQFMEKIHVIRAQYGAIGDELQGRMPLAYAHIVQILLDVVLWMYPFMALSTGMAWYIGIVGTGLLTMFYQGLFDLAKQFLDPYDNENYGKGDDPLVIDTLIAETNAGSVRWMNSFVQQPWNRQLLNDGELYDSILPLRGYSVEDLAEMEAQEEKERQDRELAIEEKKRREDDNDRLRAEQLLMEHFANIENGTSMVVGERGNATAVLTPEEELLMNSDIDGRNSYKTFMEVSGGKVVATSSLLPFRDLAPLDRDLAPSDMVNTTVAEMESNKVLTLADGTLVTLDDSLTMNTTESNTTATQASGKSATLKDAPAADVEMESNKVLTLADGTLVTLDESLKMNTTDSQMASEEKTIANDVPIAEDEPSAFDFPPLLDDTNEVAWANLGTTPNFKESIAAMENYKASPSYKALAPVLRMNSDINFNENLKDEDLEDDDIFEPLNIEWFDEIGADGQEYRLSQMLADEDFFFEEEGETEDAANDKAMTYDEFTQKATEIIEQANNEIAETKAIMSVSPGNEAEYDVSNRDSNLGPVSLPTRRNLMDEPEPMYDQTKLDGISQLWGAPPEVLEGYMVEEEDEDQALINEDVDFRNVYSLWGEGVPAGTATLDDEERITSSPSMEGFAQLWNEKLSPYEGEEDDEVDQRSSVRTIDPQAYPGFEWWDEVAEDGKEVRLSQMLADEEYYEALDDETETPMTYEQFAEETEKLIEQAEDERKETEAIMNAPPNANFLVDGEDSPEETSAVENSILGSDAFEDMITSLADPEDNAQDIISDREIDVLGLDNEGYQGDDIQEALSRVISDSDNE